MRWAGHVARIAEKRNAYRILVGKPEGRIHWEYKGLEGWTILKTDVREIEWDGTDWIGLAQDRDQWRAFVNTVDRSRPQVKAYPVRRN
jgi:hypothetical protein